MAKTIKQSFEEYSSNLNVTDKQVETVSNSRASVVKTLAKKLVLHPDQSSKLIGSYDRDTLIRYLSENDIDLMVVLHYGENKVWDTPEGTIAALGKVKSILSEAYPDTEMRVDRSAVTMRLSKFTLDVVPAFKNTDGYYRIPDTHRLIWLPTDPTEFAKKITDVNKNMSYRFVPLIKMIRGWNRENGYPIRSFHLENLLYNHCKNDNQKYSLDSLAQVFFSSLVSDIQSACYDPVTGDRLDGYLDNNAQVTKREIALAKVEKASEIARRARKYGEEYPDSPQYSIKEWKKLFGEFFPEYG